MERCLLWIVIISFFSSPVFSQIKVKNTLHHNIKKIIEGSELKQYLGISIGYFSEGEERVLIDHNSQVKMIPASLTKVITAGATLEYMPKGHRFTTQLLTKSEIMGSELKGDLYLRGGGDPSFVSETLWRLVNQFSRTGIKKIKGHIVVDDKRFDVIRFDPSREKSRVSRAYDAPIGAMSFNWNSVNIYIRPGKKAGEKALIWADPENDYIEIKNQVVTGQSKNIQISRQSTKAGDLFSVKGQIPLNSEEIVYYQGISKPDLWSGENLKSFLAQRGIEVMGSVVLGSTSSSAKLLAEEEGSEVSTIVKDMMKFSNNYVAEMMTKNLAVEAGSLPGNMGDGVQQLKSFLQLAGLKSENFVLLNPSGLTRKNQMSVSSLHKVLLYIKHNFQIFPEFLYSLPIAGVDGTLKRRLGDKTKAWVRAKTGRLTGVTGLAGFAANPQGDIFSFAFLYNGPHSKLDKANQTFDKMAVELVLNGHEVK